MSSRASRERGRAERLRALLDLGDHAAAVREARAVFAGRGADGPEGEAAEAALARIAPDRAAVAVGLAGVAAAVAIALWVLLRT